jgi:hypothetical protein
MLERKFSRAAVVEASFHSICQIIPFPSRIAHGKIWCPPQKSDLGLGGGIFECVFMVKSTHDWR